MTRCCLASPLVITACIAILTTKSACAEPAKDGRPPRLRAVYSECPASESECVDAKSTEVKDPEDVCRMMAALGRESTERVVALHLDYGKRVRAVETVAIGGMYNVSAMPRDLFRSAIVANSAYIIVVHNHPDGDADPSASDKKHIQTLEAAGKLLGIQVLDSIIVSSSGCYSVSKGKTLKLP